MKQRIKGKDNFPMGSSSYRNAARAEMTSVGAIFPLKGTERALWLTDEHVGLNMGQGSHFFFGSCNCPVSSLRVTSMSCVPAKTRHSRSSGNSVKQLIRWGRTRGKESSLPQWIYLSETGQLERSSGSWVIFFFFWLNFSLNFNREF